MRRPKLPPMPMIPASAALPPSCYQHGPHGTTGYCPKCAAARIDTDRAMFPEQPVRHRRRPSGVLAKAATITLLTTLAVVLASYSLILTGVLRWH